MSWYTTAQIGLRMAAYPGREEFISLLGNLLDPLKPIKERHAVAREEEARFFNILIDDLAKNRQIVTSEQVPQIFETRDAVLITRSEASIGPIMAIIVSHYSIEDNKITVFHQAATDNIGTQEVLMGFPHVAPRVGQSSKEFERNQDIPVRQQILDISQSSLTQNGAAEALQTPFRDIWSAWMRTMIS
jgi:Cft2 family RNA processing exonuclease